MQILLFLLTILTLLPLKFSQTWTQYTQIQYFLRAFDYSPAIRIPQGFESIHISLVGIDQHTYTSQLYNSKTSQFSASNQGNMNSTFQQTINPNEQTFFNYAFQHLNQNPQKTIIQIRDQSQNILKKQVVQDYRMFTADQISFIVNTSRPCRIRAILQGISTDVLYLLHPSDISSDSIPIFQLKSNEQTKVLVADLDQAGIWVVGIRSSTYQQTVQKIRSINIQTDPQNSCQNLCYGLASQRGSFGWNLHGSQCVCDAGYYSNPYFGCGTANCLKYGIQFSKNSPFLCQCPLQMSWNNDQHKCVPKCQGDKGSTGILLDNGECQCIQNFYWSRNQSLCVPDCNKELASAPIYSQGGILLQQCKCRQPALWNQTRSQCYIQCDKIQHSTGQYEYEAVCQCKTYTNWNPGKLQCVLNCSQIPYSSGIKISQFECQCNFGFRWKQGGFQCIRTCIQDEFTTENINDENKCQCKKNGAWNQKEGKCLKVQCQNVLYSIGYDQQTHNCLCSQNFYWNHDLSQCVLKCQNLIDPLSLKQNFNSHRCSCSSGSYWQQSTLKCVRNCSLIQKSTGVNINNQCQCHNGYFWQQNSCQNKCILESQTGTFDEVNNHCQCKPDYQWSNSYMLCILKCQKINNAYAVSQNLSECSCSNGLIWHENQRVCRYACDGKFDKNLIRNKNECSCQKNTQWSEKQGHCKLDCSTINLASGYQQNKCSCKQNAVWNQNTNQCQCRENYSYKTDTKRCQNDKIVYACIAGFLGMCGASISGAKFNHWIQGQPPTDNDDFDVMDDSFVRDTQVSGSIMISKKI